MQNETVKQRLSALSLKPLPMTQKQFSEYFRKDVDQTAEVITRAKIEIQ